MSVHLNIMYLYVMLVVLSLTYQAPTNPLPRARGLSENSARQLRF